MLTLPAPTEDTPTLADLAAALDRLDAGTTPRWGKMDAPQMVRHSARFADLYLGRIPVSLPIRLVARMIGPMFLRKVLRGSPTATPKNLGTLPAIRSVPDQEIDFAAEVAELRARFDEVAALDGVVDHPMYGKMEAESCRSLVRHHTAHHFNQFGLLGADR
ncbi:MAG: DUF1569 domain-containing protein [Planctomycetota bacterium]